MPDGLDALRRGAIGFFWPVLDRIPNLDEDEPERGHARIEEQWATVDVLEENVEEAWLPDYEPAPQAIVALMPDTAAVLLEVLPPSRTRHIIGLRASSARYRARTVIGGLDVTRLRTTEPLALHANFHGIGAWADLSSLTESQTKTPGGRLDTWTIQLKSSGRRVVTISEGRQLVLSAHWSVGGSPDRRILDTPVTIGCEGPRPKPTWDLLQPLLHVQNLLNVAFDGFVTAAAGPANMRLRVEKPDRRAPTPWMWNGALMAPPKSSKTPEMTTSPLFSLATLGGFDALRRWVKVATQHPRAVTPVINLYRHGPGTPAVTLLETAAGIEYWVKSHRPARWATSSRYANSLATKVGTAFADWVGDPDAWAKAFWEANNNLKHEPTFSPDPHELIDLAVSGRYLLAAGILDQVAGSKAASRSVFQHHRLAMRGDRLKQRFA